MAEIKTGTFYNPHSALILAKSVQKDFISPQVFLGLYYGGQKQRDKFITGTEYSPQLDAVDTVSVFHNSPITFCVYNNIFR